jgi:hypothetical protein
VQLDARKARASRLSRIRKLVTVTLRATRFGFAAGPV